ncbi:MAG: hypothetical protein CMJ18_12550, partial [Phycisphaeraceae bacterium]|nr:hypothetical protein [Phycisphaeraceae bacterium]
RRSPNPGARRPHALCAALLFVMFIQLALGAVVRHTGAGLAIPDFPASYGGLVPPMTEQGIIDAADAMDLDPDVHPEYALPWQVGVHFAHRLWAIAVVVTAGIAIASIAKGGADSWLRRPALAIAAMLVVQVALGAFTVLSDRHTEVATAHQAMGAALIATTMLLLVRAMLSNGAALASQESEARPADDLTSRTTITANP